MLKLYLIFKKKKNLTSSGINRNPFPSGKKPNNKISQKDGEFFTQ